MRKQTRIILLVFLATLGNYSLAQDSVVPTPIAPSLDSTPPSSNEYNELMEKCRVLDNNGNGLIKPYMADSGINLQGDASAWIWVPYGQCAKINKGDFSGVPSEIMAKIDASNIQLAPTLGE